MKLILILGFLFLAHCSSTPSQTSKGPNLSQNLSEPEKKIKKAKSLQGKKLYEEALGYLKDFKSAHPSHPMISEVDLRAADIYFLQKRYPEALYAYKLFRELYPRHKKADYAYYQEAMSHFVQVPKVSQRDLSSAIDGVVAFRKLISSYPKSPYVNEAKKNIRSLLNRMMEKEFRIAQFFFKQKKYMSVSRRSSSFLKRHPKSHRISEVLYMASFSALKLKDKKTAKKYYKKLMKRKLNPDLLVKIEKDLSGELRGK